MNLRLGSLGPIVCLLMLGVLAAANASRDVREPSTVRAKDIAHQANEHSQASDATTRLFPPSKVRQTERAINIDSSSPAQGASGVDITAGLTITFSKPVRKADLNASNFILFGPQGTTPVQIVTGGSGKSALVQPEQELLPGTAYSLLVQGIRSLADETLPLHALDFRTAALAAPKNDALDPRQDLSASDVVGAVAQQADTTFCNGKRSKPLSCIERSTMRDAVWTPGLNNINERWRVPGRQPDLMNTALIRHVTETIGLTTLTGQVLRVDGVPVADVEVSLGELAVRTDSAGRFWLYGPPSGRQEIYVDGTTASRAGVEYGQFVVGIDIKAGTLTQVPYAMYVPRITARDKIHFASPMQRDTVLTHPDIPGLNIHIPAGSVIRDRKGRVVRELAIVPTPVNRAPFPVPVNCPVLFSLQPGGAVIESTNPGSARGVRIYYPNYDQHIAGTQANFWIYDPVEDWRVYGKGQVTADGSRFAPQPGVELRNFMGVMAQVINADDPGPEDGMAPDCQTCGEDNIASGSNATTGDPIDLRTGNYTYFETDITIADISSITLGRAYRPRDYKKREFGIGIASSFSHRLHIEPSGVKQLVLPNGVPLRFIKTEPQVNAKWWHYGTTSMSGASLDAEGNNYVITKRDGSRMVFHTGSPNRLLWTEDRYGNRTTYVRDAGLVSRIISPSGRYIDLEYDSENRIESARDSLGNEWRYEYDPAGSLKKVIYPDLTFKSYTYQSFPLGDKIFCWITEVYDRRGNRVLENVWSDDVASPSFRRVIRQTLADGGIYDINYAHNDGTGVATLVTHPDGSKRRVVFSGTSVYPISDTMAYGTPLSRTHRFERNDFDLLTARVDALGRRTEYSYDEDWQGNKITYLADTPEAIEVKISYTAEGKLQSVTAPFGRITRFEYENGCLTNITKPYGNAIAIACNSRGQPVSITDDLFNQTRLNYLQFDLSSVVDPLGREVTFSYDALGRNIATEDAVHNSRRREYDAESRVVKMFDGEERLTEVEYDPNGNITGVLLPHENGITYEYDDSDRLITRTDSLNQSESWTYDAMSRVETYTDRKGQTTTFDYDDIGRLETTTYHDGSTVTASYDDGDRLRNLVDSNTGTLSWDYDDFDRTIEATTAQGSIVYEYDDAGRRTAMTVASQPRIDYQYDTNDRLRRILQGSEVIDFAYDAADRLIETTLPNGVRTGYAYNKSSQVTGIAWLKPDSTLLGDIGYGYDNQGRRVTQTGGFASNLLPAASVGNTFDDNNRQTQFNGQSLTYDTNGNLASDGTRTYIWNARDQLVEIKQGSTTVASFSYDALGRRYTKTEGGQAVAYIYDGLDAVQEIQGTIINPILTGLGIDERYARNDNSGRTYFLTDALGSTRALTNAQGNIVQRYDYTPYGHTTQTNSGFNNPYQYTGRERDTNGMYYYRARYYSAGMGRFISEDPLGLSAGDSNIYAYVSGDPISYTDPTGEVALLGAALGGLGNLGYQLYKNGGNLDCVNWWQVGAWALTGSGAGIIGRAGVSGIGNFVWNSSRFSNISRTYWGARGGAGSMSLDHWAISQAAGRSGAAPQGLVNGGWNLLEMPRTWNTWLGFAPNWGGTQGALASAARLGIQVGVPATAAASGYAGYQVGTNAQQSTCGCQ